MRITEVAKKFRKDRMTGNHRSRTEEVRIKVEKIVKYRRKGKKRKLLYELVRTEVVSIRKA